MLIVISQLKVLFGLDVHGNDIWQLLVVTVESLPQFKPTTTLIGLAGFAALLFAKYFLGAMVQRFGMNKLRADFSVRMAPLLVVLFATLVVVGFDLDTLYGVAVVGAIGQGLSGLSTLALGSLLAVTGIIVGSWIAMQWLKRRL